MQEILTTHPQIFQQIFQHSGGLERLSALMNRRLRSNNLSLVADKQVWDVGAAVFVVGAYRYFQIVDEGAQLALFNEIRAHVQKWKATKIEEFFPRTPDWELEYGFHARLFAGLLEADGPRIINDRDIREWISMMAAYGLIDTDESSTEGKTLMVSFIKALDHLQDFEAFRRVATFLGIPYDALIDAKHRLSLIRAFEQDLTPYPFRVYHSRMYLPNYKSFQSFLSDCTKDI